MHLAALAIVIRALIDALDMRPAVVAHSDRLANRHDGELPHNTDLGCGGTSGRQGPGRGHTQQCQLQRCKGHQNVAAQSIQRQGCLQAPQEFRNGKEESMLLGAVTGVLRSSLD